MMMARYGATWLFAAASVPLLLGACSQVESDWGRDFESSDPVALRGAVALRDAQLNRLLFLTANDKDGLHTEFVPAGQNISALEASADLNQLFVLARGVFPRRAAGDERPSLTVFDGRADAESGRLIKRFALDDPMERLALDSQGEWVAAFGGDATVVNPNELVLFDLKSGDGATGETQSKTIRSFGGAPEELLFTEELLLPQGGARRLLVVRTDRDITLVDLKNLTRSEVTVKLPESSNGLTLKPLQVVYDDGEPEVETDARLAVRLENSSDVMIITLSEAVNAERDFSPVLNIVDVGGVPSSIDFVRTDGGLRLAALLPNQRQATLVNPKTTTAEVVPLPARFSDMRRITSLVSDAPESGDVALLWGDSSSIGFWSLSSTSETPYRSVDTAELSFSVQEVIDVPEPNAHLKVLRGAGSDLFVLDLERRQSFPLTTDFSAAEVSVSPDGERLWAYQEGKHGFSSIRLEDLHPEALYVDAGTSGVFDIERTDEGRAAIVLHGQRGWDATLLDAVEPDSAQTRFFPALHLKGVE